MHSDSARDLSRRERVASGHARPPILAYSLDRCKTGRATMPRTAQSIPVSSDLTVSLGSWTSGLWSTCGAGSAKRRRMGTTRVRQPLLPRPDRAKTDSWGDTDSSGRRLLWCSPVPFRLWGPARGNMGWKWDGPMLLYLKELQQRTADGGAAFVAVSRRGESVSRVRPNPDTLDEIEPFRTCSVLEHMLWIFLFVWRRARQVNRTGIVGDRIR